ncbi:hypothetical protein L9F63_016211, partial [Diploptera punctata]
MDNFGFQQDVDEAVFSMGENSNSSDNTNINTSGSPHLLTNQNYSFASNHKTKLSTSCSFNIPKNKTLNKYRRFSESFSSACRPPQRAINNPSAKASEKIKCDITVDNKSMCDTNYSAQIKNDSMNFQRRSSDDSGYIGITSTPKKRQLPLDEFQKNKLNICSSQINFHDSMLSSVQDIVSVPSLSLNNSLFNSKPSISLQHSSSLNKSNIITDTSIDILKTFSTPGKQLKSKNMFANSTPNDEYFNKMNSCIENTSSLGNHHKYMNDDSVLNSLSKMINSQNNVNKVLNRSTTLPAVSTKNHDFFLNQTSAIQTVSGTVPMFHPGYPQASPRPCAENRQNMRRSSKILRDSCQMSGDKAATLKRRSILRGWKLQFIPSDHSKRRAVALCCILLLACALVLAASGLIVYITT